MLKTAANSLCPAWEIGIRTKFVHFIISLLYFGKPYWSTFLQVRDGIRDYFVTGKWRSDEDANELLKMADLDDDDAMFGDFEDLEAGVAVKGDENEDTEAAGKLS